MEELRQLIVMLEEKIHRLEKIIESRLAVNQPSPYKSYYAEGENPFNNAGPPQTYHEGRYCWVRSPHTGKLVKELIPDDIPEKPNPLGNW